jgi:polar amino acid transport system substrate-binding protein
VVSAKINSVDFANLRLSFRGIAGDPTGQPQHWGMPPEKHSQQHESQRQPERQPEQCAAEGLFGGATVTQGTQQEGKKQADESIAEIEGNAFERKNGGASMRFDQGVQVIGEEKTNRDHGGAKWKGEHHAPPSPAQRQSDQGCHCNYRYPTEIPSRRAPVDHPAGNRRDHEAERSKCRPDQTVTGCWQIDQPEVRAREGQEEPGDRVEEQTGKNDEERDRRMRDPGSCGQYPLERGFLRQLWLSIGLWDVTRRFPARLPHTYGGTECQNGRDEIKINWKTQRRALGKGGGKSERGGDRVDKPGIIDRPADEHRDNQSYRLVSGHLVEDLRPLRGPSALSKRIKNERLICATGHALCDTAEQSVGQTKEKEQCPSACWRHAKEHHLYDHCGAGGDDEGPASDPISKRAGRQVGADNGDSPREIKQGVLSRAQAEVEEQHCQDRVIKPRVEEYAEKDKAPPIAIGGIINIASGHSNWAGVSALPAAIAYLNSLLAVTLAFLATNFLSVGAAHSQEPAASPPTARTRLVVGLTQSPPFCIHGEDGSWSGISVELWHWIAADLGVDTEFRESTVTGLFDDLAPGRPLDVSIGALTITAEREDRLDFSESFYLSGLSVAVKTAPSAGGVLAWLERVLVWNFWRIVAALIASLVLVALLIWALEHKSNPKEFGGEGKVHRGIGSALWWSAVTMTTVGYGDLAPRSAAGRLVALAWMFISLFLVSWFTASMASILTTERMDAGTGGLVVRGPDDLRRLHVGAIAGTSSEDYLRRHQVDYLRVPAKEFLDVLLTGRVQAVLGDAPTLRYVARSEMYAGKITVLPQTFQLEPYGIALRDGSPWRKPVDRALLHRLASPEWPDLLYRYTGGTE